MRTPRPAALHIAQYGNQIIYRRYFIYLMSDRGYDVSYDNIYNFIPDERIRRSMYIFIYHNSPPGDSSYLAVLLASFGNIP